MDSAPSEAEHGAREAPSGPRRAQRPAAERAHRIVVGLDASPDSEAALRAAVLLASALEAEVHGVFVEDERLLRAAALPCSRQLWPVTGSAAAFDPLALASLLRWQARQAERLLALVASARGVTWSFRVLRGPVAEAVMEAARSADLLVLGRTSAPAVRRTGPGRTAVEVAERAARPVLLLGARGAPDAIERAADDVLATLGGGAERDGLSSAARATSGEGPAGTPPWYRPGGGVALLVLGVGGRLTDDPVRASLLRSGGPVLILPSSG
jgi:nucleotide-binding universal stress UspA family protein